MSHYFRDNIEIHSLNKKYEIYVKRDQFIEELESLISKYTILRGISNDITIDHPHVEVIADWYRNKGNIVNSLTYHSIRSFVKKCHDQLANTTIMQIIEYLCLKPVFEIIREGNESVLDIKDGNIEDFLIEDHIPDYWESLEYPFKTENETEGGLLAFNVNQNIDEHLLGVARVVGIKERQLDNDNLSSVIYKLSGWIMNNEQTNQSGERTPQTPAKIKKGLGSTH